MKKNKILVLSDSKKSLSKTLRSSISLAKLINGEISVLSIQKPTEVIKEDNQLSAMRELNDQFIATHNDLENIAKTAKAKFDVKVDYSFAIGQYESEAKQCIAKQKPDVIVIAKKKRTFLKPATSRLAEFVINNFSGPILVTDSKKSLKTDKSLSLGVYDSLNHDNDRIIFDNLIKSTSNPIKSFKIVDSNNKEANNGNKLADTIEFIFEQNNNSINNLAKYLEKNGVNLLYLDRENILKRNRKELEKIINTIKIPMLLSKKAIA